jgi:dTDP-4-dehydrorhamnose 3,5-epimerase
MEATPTDIPDVLLIQPKVFGDARGFFMESWNEREFTRLGINARFVQDNHSRSARGVLRGLHYQVKQPQGKLVRVVAGEIFDVVLDIRRSSPTFGRKVTVRLSAAEHRMLWVPPRLAHGFCVMSDMADVLYKSSDFYAPEHERTILWNDPALGIGWPLGGNEPLLSAKDKLGKLFSEAELFD